MSVMSIDNDNTNYKIKSMRRFWFYGNVCIISSTVTPISWCVFKYSNQLSMN